MKNDYLWDRSGAPDPEIEQLEKLLAPLRSDAPPPKLFAVSKPPLRWHAIAAVAALLIAAAGLSRVTIRPAWDVAVVEGETRVERRTIFRNGRLQAGESLRTGEASSARLEMGSVGVVVVGPNSHLRLIKTRPNEYRLALERGVIQATIVAPPRRFFVDTPSAVAVDLGCVYTLSVEGDGAGFVSVTLGWVAFEHNGRESFIPAGAACRTRPGAGPGTPFRESAPDSLRGALEQFDFSRGGEASEPALAIVLAASTPEDAFTLWHLLFRTTGPQRERVYQRLAVLAPPPGDVTREAALALERTALDRWWDALGLGDTSWWRLWKTDEPGGRSP